MTILTIAFCALTISAGQWQTRRADEKLARQARLDARAQAVPIELDARPIAPEAFEWMRVRVTGEWVAAGTIFLDNRVYRQQAGYRVLTPLKIHDSVRHVLVDRGWIAAGPRRGDLPDIATPSTTLTIEGLVTLPSTKYLELRSTQPEGRLWQNLALDRYRAATGLDLQPIVLVQTSSTSDSLERHLEPPGSGAERNRAYALQWYSFAAIAIGLFVFFGSRRKRNDDVIPAHSNPR